MSSLGVMSGTENKCPFSCSCARDLDHVDVLVSAGPIASVAGVIDKARCRVYQPAVAAVYILGVAPVL